MERGHNQRNLQNLPVGNMAEQERAINETPTNPTNRQRISSSEISDNHTLPDSRGYALRDIRREMFVNEKPETPVDIDRSLACNLSPNGDVDSSERDANGTATAMAPESRSADSGDEVNAKMVADDDCANRPNGISSESDCDNQMEYNTKKRDKKNQKRTAKTISTKAESDWLKRIFPKVIKGEKGHFAIKNSGAGFDVYFRVDKRQTGAEPINLKFPYLTRETFTYWKGLSNANARKAAEKYVRGHLGNAIASGDDRARIVAGKLSDVA